MLKIAQYLSKL